MKITILFFQISKCRADPGAIDEQPHWYWLQDNSGGLASLPLNNQSHPAERQNGKMTGNKCEAQHKCNTNENWNYNDAIQGRNCAIVWSVNCLRWLIISRNLYRPDATVPCVTSFENAQSRRRKEMPKIKILVNACKYLIAFGVCMQMVFRVRHIMGSTKHILDCEVKNWCSIMFLVCAQYVVSIHLSFMSLVLPCLSSCYLSYVVNIYVIFLAFCLYFVIDIHWFCGSIIIQISLALISAW